MNYKNIEWKKYKGVLLPVVPPHQTIYLSKEEQKDLLKLSNAHLIRWISEWDIPAETNYWYIIKDSFNGFNEYSSGTRNKVRKGFKNCIVRQISCDYLIQNGYKVYANAYLNYQKKDKAINKIPSKKTFIDTYSKVREKGEFWGVFDKDQNTFIAFAENVIRDGAVIYGSMKFDPAYMKSYPSYALIHTMNEYYLDKLSLRYVSDGPRSILHESNVQEMLMRVFKFRKAYCRLNLAFSSLAKLSLFYLYPFRKIIYRINQRPFKELKAVLMMMEILKKDAE